MRSRWSYILLTVLFVLLFCGISQSATYEVLLEGVFSGNQEPGMLRLYKVNGRSLPGIARYTRDFSKVNGRYVGFVNTTFSSDQAPSVFSVSTSYLSSDGRGGSSGPKGDVGVIFKRKVVVAGQEFFDVYYGRFER